MTRAALHLLLVVTVGIVVACDGRTAMDSENDPPTEPFNVVETGIPEIQEALSSGRVTSRQIVIAYLARIATYRPDQAPDYYFTFGYYQARAVAQVLERAAELGDFTRAGIVRAMADVGTLRFDGLSGDYAYGPPARRVPPRASTIFAVDPAKPLGLAGLAVNLETETARRYLFP